jgi:transcriptional regulator with XRE-family HTH domain
MKIGKTYKEISEETGINQTYLNYFFCGHRVITNKDFLSKIATSLSTDYSVLFKLVCEAKMEDFRKKYGKDDD